MPNGGPEDDSVPVSDEKDLGDIERGNSGIVHIEPKEFVDDVVVEDDD